MTTVVAVVAQALRDGHLYGARPGRATKTLTVEGLRVSRIRLQADVFGAFYSPAAVTPYYPALRPLILEALRAVETSGRRAS